MVSWATDGANWPTIESELSSKGVKVNMYSPFISQIPYNWLLQTSGPISGATFKNKVGMFHPIAEYQNNLILGRILSRLIKMYISHNTG